jgi:hypothetical protein
MGSGFRDEKQKSRRNAGPNDDEVIGITVHVGSHVFAGK